MHIVPNNSTHKSVQSCSYYCDSELEITGSIYAQTFKFPVTPHSLEVMMNEEDKQMCVKYASIMCTMHIT